MQVCPVAANTPATRPFAAASRSASGNTICGDLPPSSSVTLLMFSAAALRDRSAGRGRAGERDLVHARVRGQRRAHLPAQPGDHVDHARREARLRRASSANASVDAGECSDGLTTTVQPAASAGASFQRQQQQRRVPRRDRRDHADRLAPGVDEVVRVRRGDLTCPRACRPARRSSGTRRGRPRIWPSISRYSLPESRHLQAGEPLGVGLDLVGEPVHQPRPVEPGQRAPLAVQRCSSGRHRGVHVLGRAVGNHRPGGPGVGILRGEGLPRRRIDELPADGHPEPLEILRRTLHAVPFLTPPG